MGSIPNYGGALVDPGRIEFVHEGPIQLGEMTGETTPRLLELKGMLEALTEVQLSSNIWGQVWAKEVYSAQVVFSALANAPVRETLGVERYARVSGAIVREALEIAEANGIEVEAFDFFDPANYRPQTPEDTQKLLANVNHAIWLLKKDQDKKAGHDFKKKGSGHLVGHRLPEPPLRGARVERQADRLRRTRGRRRPSQPNACAR